MPTPLRPERKSKTLARFARAYVHAAVRFGRRHRILLGSLIVPAILGAVTGAVVYHHYAGVIDSHVKSAPFDRDANVYGAPLVYSAGDPLDRDEIATQLRLVGYREGTRGSKTFSRSQTGISVVPAEGGSVHIELGRSQISAITVNGRRASEWAAGSPLFANLSPTREKRRLVTFSQIPRNLVNAVSSVEDKHFFTHSGLDIPRIVKAALVDLRSGRKEQGASTLTMQLVRDLYLEPEKRWKRKIAEAMMTVHLEREWSKQKIFETYANEVYLGQQADYSIRGFAEAAQFYFGKPLPDLTLPEAATLAGMVQRPNHFNPYRNPEGAAQRRNVVLRLMRANDYISEETYRASIAAPLETRGRQAGNDAWNTSWVLDLVTDDLEKAGREDGGNGAVNTSIDLNLQRAATEAIASGMASVDKALAARYKKGAPRAEAALIAVDPHTGEIRALVGGRDYAASQFNRILSKRPPGSVFKPFVYAAALETAIEGGEQVLTPASLVDDTPTTFGSGRNAYTPSNFKHESFGTLTFREALAHSDNIAAVRVAEMAGYNNVVAVARRAGLNDGIQPTPAVALGSYVTSPLEIAGAYTAFANEGMWVEPRITAGAAAPHRALDPRVAFLITNMMEEVLRSGTGAGVRSRGFVLPAAGKTGTSHDGWFAGFTSQLLCIVWVGFDDYEDLNLEGAKSALPIWTDFMTKASKFGHYRKAVEFPDPSGIESAKICNHSGKLAGAYCTDTRNEVFIAGTQPTDTCDLDLPQALPVQNVVPPVAAPAVALSPKP